VFCASRTVRALGETADNFCLFRPLKGALHGRHFRSDDEVNERWTVAWQSHRRLLLSSDLWLSGSVVEGCKTWGVGVGGGYYMEDQYHCTVYIFAI